MERLAFAAMAMATLVSSAFPAELGRVTAVRVESEIRTQGARAVLHRYYDTPEWSASILPGVRSAKPAWLSVAERLRTEADGGAAEDLGLALYGALAVAPFRVVPILQRAYGGTVDQVCNVSFESEVPSGGVGVYLQRVRAELASAKTKQQHAVAAACLRGLNLSQEAALARGLK